MKVKNLHGRSGKLSPEVCWKRSVMYQAAVAGSKELGGRIPELHDNGRVSDCF